MEPRPTLARWVVCAALLAPLAAHAQTYETTEVADGVYRFRWQNHNGFFVSTPAGVVAFDPIHEEAAARYGAEIARVVPGASLVAIVYSHSDADHATGATALMEAMGQDDVPIMAHEAAVAPIRERGDPAQPEPTVTFAERMTWHPGGRAIELHYVGPSHTDNLIVGFVPDVGVAFAVDFVAHDRVGFRELPGFHFPEMLDAIGVLLDVPFTRVVFGHGPDGDRASVQRQLTYYDDLRAAVTAAIRDGLSEDEAAERVRLDRYAGWSQYEAWFPLDVRGLYRLYAGGS